MRALEALEAVHLGWRKRLPIVLQTEAAECGLACLAMVAAYHGRQSDLAELRRRFGMSLRGATLKDLMSVADGLGLATRPVRLELDELQLLGTPSILHWELNHFVVLKKVGSRALVIHDPAVGLRKLPLSEVSRKFTGVALELSPMASFEQSTALPRVRMRALLGNMVGLKRSLSQVLVLAFAIQIFAVISPLFMQWVVDHALLTADQNLLTTLALGFSLLLLLRVSISTMRGWMLIALSTSLKVQGRANLFSHLLNLPAAYFETRHLGDVMSRFGSQETILRAVTTDLIEAVLDGFLVVVTLFVMFMFAPGLAAVVVAGAALYGLLRWISYEPLRQASAEAIAWGARRDSHFLETLRGVKTIKLFNGQEGRRSRWLNLMVETVNRQLATRKMRLMFRSSKSLLIGSIAILVVWLGARRVMENTFTVGMLLAFVAYKDQFLTRVSALIDRVLELQMLKLHAERLADIALTDPEPRDPTVDHAEGAHDAQSIEVRGLRFRYSENDPWVLDGVDFRVEKGESVAVVGPSGCGKTTLLKLLASLLQPSEGEILVEGKPLAAIGAERYRSAIGAVMQEDKLFAGSIAENISFFSERPDPSRLEACAQLAAVHDDIVAMPMGYSTLIGDMGTVLSGGQKQRVLIARALYRQPGILLLDEATSYLDVQREEEVNAAIRASRVTRIVVAHRPHTIQSADRVLRIEKGKVSSEAVPGRPEWRR